MLGRGGGKQIAAVFSQRRNSCFNHAEVKWEKKNHCELSTELLNMQNIIRTLLGCRWYHVSVWRSSSDWFHTWLYHIMNESARLKAQTVASNKSGNYSFFKGILNRHFLRFSKENVWGTFIILLRFAFNLYLFLMLFVISKNVAGHPSSSVCKFLQDVSNSIEPLNMYAH